MTPQLLKCCILAIEAQKICIDLRGADALSTLPCRHSRGKGHPAALPLRLPEGLKQVCHGPVLMVQEESAHVELHNKSVLRGDTGGISLSEACDDDLNPLREKRQQWSGGQHMAVHMKILKEYLADTERFDFLHSA